MFHLSRLFAQNVLCYTCFRRIDSEKVRKCAFCSPVCVLTVLQISKALPSRLLLWDLQRFTKIRVSGQNSPQQLTLREAHLCSHSGSAPPGVCQGGGKCLELQLCGYQNETYGVRSVPYLQSVSLLLDRDVMSSVTSIVLRLRFVPCICSFGYFPSVKL